MTDDAQVPFHAAGYPCTEHSDECGLYDMLTVEDLVAALPVGKVEQMTAMLRKQPHFQPAVLQREIPVFFIQLLIVQNILHRIGVNASLRTLVDAPGVKNRGLVIAARRICRQRNETILKCDRAAHLYFIFPFCMAMPSGVLITGSLPFCRDTDISPCGVGTVPSAYSRSPRSGLKAILRNPGSSGSTPKIR